MSLVCAIHSSSRQWQATATRCVCAIFGCTDSVWLTLGSHLAAYLASPTLAEQNESVQRTVERLLVTYGVGHGIEDLGVVVRAGAVRVGFDGKVGWCKLFLGDAAYLALLRELVVVQVGHHEALFALGHSDELLVVLDDLPA